MTIYQINLYYQHVCEIHVPYVTVFARLFAISPVCTHSPHRPSIQHPFTMADLIPPLEELHPLHPDIIRNQATINIGKEAAAPMINYSNETDLPLSLIQALLGMSLTVNQPWSRLFPV